MAEIGAVICVGDGGIRVESLGFWRMEIGLANTALTRSGEDDIMTLFIPSISLSRADLGSLMNPSLTFDWITSSADCVFDLGRIIGLSSIETRRVAASVVWALDMGTLLSPSRTGVLGGGDGRSLSVPIDTGRRLGISASRICPDALDECRDSVPSARRC